MVAKSSFHFGTELRVALAHQELLYPGNTQDSDVRECEVAVPKDSCVHGESAQRIQGW